LYAGKIAAILGGVGLTGPDHRYQAAPG